MTKPATRRVTGLQPSRNLLLALHIKFKPRSEFNHVVLVARWEAQHRKALLAPFERGLRFFGLVVCDTSCTPGYDQARWQAREVELANHQLAYRLAHVRPVIWGGKHNTLSKGEVRAGLSAE